MIASRDDLDAARAECRRMVTHYALASGAIGVLPVPGVDLVVDVFSLGRLLTRINARFGVGAADLRGMDARAKAILLGAVTGGGGEFIGKRLGAGLARRLIARLGPRMLSGSAARIVPLAGAMASAGISFAAMKAIGNLHVEECHAAVGRLLDAADRALAP